MLLGLLHECKARLDVKSCGRLELVRQHIYRSDCGKLILQKVAVEAALRNASSYCSVIKQWLLSKAFMVSMQV